jgi:oligopeptide transport system substrate-binding protein
MPRATTPLALALMLTACGGDAPGDRPLAVSAIGGPARAADPNAGPLGTPERALLYATAQGLVRFDAAGGIEPGLAERWLVSDEGRSYVFRLREAEWTNGEPVTAEQVVRELRRAAAANSRNALAPFLAVIDEIVEMTPQVIEVRLKRPRPDLLKLFAQPEMTVPVSGGSGPFRIQEDRGSGVLLRPAFDPNLIADEDVEEPGPGTHVRLRGERAASAIVRFRNGDADLVLGGSFADWPLLAAAEIPAEAIRVDPAVGLFGLAIVSREGFLGTATNRAALSMAIDRAALTQAFRPEWTPVETLLPARLDSASAPAAPDWVTLTLDERRDRARAAVRDWKLSTGEPLALRIALPAGPGGNLVWNAVGGALAAIGIVPRRVQPGEPADLQLIDAVAPYDSARWYLVTACRLCNEASATVITAARDAETLEARAARIAEADAALTADIAYIAIAQPLRWAIVTPANPAWQGNARAWHPLNHLRNEPR